MCGCVDVWCVVCGVGVWCVVCGVWYGCVVCSVWCGCVVCVCGCVSGRRMGGVEQRGEGTL